MQTGGLCVRKERLLSSEWLRVLATLIESMSGLLLQFLAE